MNSWPAFLPERILKSNVFYFPFVKLKKGDFMSAHIDKNTEAVISIVESFLPKTIGTNFIFAKCQIESEPDLRVWFTHEMRGGSIKVVAARIYAYQKSFPVSDATSPIAPSAVARALCRQHGWRVALPMTMAHFLLGLETKPTRCDAFFYDGADHRSYERAGLRLEAVDDHRLFDLTPVGQAIRLGAPEILTPAEIAKIAKFAASAWFGGPLFRLFLEDDLASGRLFGGEADLAQAILDSPRSGVERKAPSDFTPADHTNSAKILNWRIIKDESGNEYLNAEHIKGHAHIPDGGSLGHSTALVWIDEALGWARTRSRFYRLIGPKLR
jgi:hypothetical protein